MIEDKDISIVIPTRGRPELLNWCVRSIREETDILITIIDNNSEKKDLIILRKMKELYNNVNLIELPNRLCLVKLWNLGYMVTPSRYMMICADKITLKPGWLEPLKKMLEKYEYVIFSSQHNAFCLDKILISKIGWFDERFESGGYEDVDYMLRAQEKGLVLGNINGFLQHQLTQKELDEKRKIAISGKPERGKVKSWDLQLNFKIFQKKWKILIPNYDINTVITSIKQVERILPEIDWHPAFTEEIKKKGWE